MNNPIVIRSAITEAHNRLADIFLLRLRDALAAQPKVTRYQVEESAYNDIEQVTLQSEGCTISVTIVTGKKVA